MNLTNAVQRFFADYLPQIKGASDRTIDAYRHSFTLFLKFAASRNQMPFKQLQMQHLTLELILSFLNYLEKKRGNSARTRNARLVAIKSFAKMLRLLYPEYRNISETIRGIPQKRAQRRLIGFLTHDQVLKVFAAVDLKSKEGFRNYTLLHLLYDSGARASEVAGLKLGDVDLEQRTLAIVGKGNRYRLVPLWPKTVQLLKRYVTECRPVPSIPYKQSLFVNQRRQALTRHGIYRICHSYLSKSLNEKQLKHINPAHSFRHSCAVNMLLSGASLTEIKNHLGHENLNSTMIYLHMNIPMKRQVQKRFIEYTQSSLPDDIKTNELVDWENKTQTLRWLDSL